MQPPRSVLSNAYLGRTAEERGPGRASQGAKPQDTEDNNHGSHSTVRTVVVTVVAQHDLKTAMA